jgi:uncharacterized protein
MNYLIGYFLLFIKKDIIMAKDKREIGSISWTDLTVSNADEIRDFYSKVVGWKFEFVSMGEYSDYSMLTSKSKKAVAGICHAEGKNTNLPAQWLMYITVESLDESIEDCLKLGGKIVTLPQNYSGMGKYCIIQDPAGAVCALFEETK